MRDFNWELSWEFYLHLAQERIEALKKRNIRIAELAASKPLSPGYHGRWDELTVDDVKMLIKMGIEIDS